MTEIFRPLFLLQALLLALALVSAVRVRAGQRAVLGRILLAQRSRGKLRWAAWIVLALVTVLAVSYRETFAGVQDLAFAGLGAAALLVWLQPSPRDSALGEDGVQRGWHARSFRDLEEWRLTGDHLRWRLFGQWISTDVPAAMHPQVREKLLAICPDKESPHGMGKPRPDYA